MSALQVENGHYTRIVNEVIEQLVNRGLLGSELALLLFVIRKTWGFNKKEDVISLTQFEQALNLSRHTVIKTIKSLVEMKLLVKRSTLGNQEITYNFNKYWNEWLVKTPSPVQKKMPTSAIQRLKLVKGYTPELVKGYTHTKDKRKQKKTKGYELFKSRAQLIGKLV